MFGPLFRYELTRLARGGLQPKLRAAFAVLLLVVLFLSYLAAFPGVGPVSLITRIDEPLTVASASRFGERFLVAFLFAQAAGVVLVTPAVAGGAIGEEKDRRSLDLLLTTSLSSWEIVAGKLAARLVFVASLLLTGLPVVTLVIFLGGVDIAQLLGGYLIAVCTICSLGAFTLCLTVVSDTSGGAILRAYVWGIGVTVAGAACCCGPVPAFFSPVGSLLVLFEEWRFTGSNGAPGLGTLLVIYAIVHLGLAALFSVAAAQQLRSVAPPAPPPTDSQPEQPSPIKIPVTPRRRISLDWVDDDPLRWKERHFAGWNPFAVSAELFTISVLLLPLVVMVFSIAWVVGRDAAWVFALIGLTAGLAAFLAAGLRAAQSVAGERRRGTLDPLLTLPIDRREILDAKFSAAFRAAIPAAALACVIVVLGVVRTALALPAVVGLPLVLAGWVVGLVGFGLWLSVRCASQHRAIGWLLGVLLVMCVLPALLGEALAEEIPRLAGLVNGFSPATALWGAIGPDWNWHRGGDWPAWFGALVAAALVAGTGMLFGSHAAREFEKRN